MVTGERKHSVVQKRLDVNDILVAEFEYIATTAFQVNEDRARVSSHYLVLVGLVFIGIQFKLYFDWVAK